MKKGFTLVELLGVIIILTVLILLVIPSVVNLVKGSSKDIDDTTKKLLYDAAKIYISDNSDYYKESNGNKFCISIKDLISNKYLDSEVKLFEKEKDITNTKVIEVKYQNGYDFELKNTSECEEKILYMDPTGASAPDLMNNSLVPIVYDEETSSWKVADPTTEWYDYNKKQWANAVILKENINKGVGDKVTIPNSSGGSSDVKAMFVWIPRYSYTIQGKYGKDGTSSASPGTIDIKFVNKYTKEDGSATYTGDKPTGWYTHPAFTFGDDELSGIWVGKFETSHITKSQGQETTDTGANLGCTTEECKEADNLRILPNVPSLRYNNVSNMYYAARSIARAGNAFNLSSLTTDSHMMKNSEWGAVAYLSQSKYGKIGEVYKNNCSKFITGIGGDSASASRSDETCTKEENKYNGTSGVNASTTGNITGVYDMSGGAEEYVMGYLTTASDTWGSTLSGNYSGFTTKPDLKYYDAYTTTDALTACNNSACNGQALEETNGWYGDISNFVSSDNPWLMRGGNGNTLFRFGQYYGGSFSGVSFRVVLSPINLG